MIMMEFIMDTDEAMDCNDLVDKFSVSGKPDRRDSIPSTVYTTDSSDIADGEELSQSPENHRQYFDSSSCPGPDHTAILSSSEGKLVASNLPWTDENGVTGSYTGEVERIVNVIKRSFIQPHGPGALIYQDGSARTCIWVHGTAAELWIPNTNIRGGKSKKKKKKKKKEKTHRNNASANKRSKSIPSRLSLGDTGTPNDMLIDFDPAQIDLLQRLDFAFVKRSDDRWTYGIIADRKDVDHIRFVVDTNGSTKTLARKCWAKAIRLVNPTPSSSSRDEAVELEKKIDPKVDNTCTFYTL